MNATNASSDSQTVAALIARLLQARGVERLFGLQGGHIQPIWDQAIQRGLRVVDVRDEGAAVHMAQAQAELLGGVGVAMATAGPGVTNTVTAIATAHVARTPLLLIGGCPPRPQANLGALQDLPHVEILRPITRHARTVRVAEHAPRELDEAVARALGDGGEPGPVYLEFPTDVLRETVPPALVLEEQLRPKPPRRLAPDPAGVAAAVELLWQARRPLVITGRGARGAGQEVARLLDRLGAVYLDTQESRGLVPDDHPAVVGALRGAAMQQTDLVLVIGRKLDYQLGYGSPAVFPHATFLRLSDNALELIDNRRGAVELLATPALALEAILDVASNRPPATDIDWARRLREQHHARVARYTAGLASAPPGRDGRMHPNRIFAALERVLRPDAIRVADGGDILSFARVAFSGGAYLDSGAVGCLGVGVPFAIAAALAFPDRQVVSVNGDGAFGINAMELDTAVRHGAKAVFIIANNAAWNIERYDQETNYDGRVSGTELRLTEYAMLARALGAYGERVEEPDELPAALERAFANAPALLDVLVSRDAVSSDATKGLSYVPDYQPLTAWDEAEGARRGPTRPE